MKRKDKSIEFECTGDECLDCIGPCEAEFLARHPKPFDDSPGAIEAWEMMRDSEAFVDWAEEQYRQAGYR